MESGKERKLKFEHWLANASPEQITAYTLMPGDASLRSYYRVITATASYVAMNAPPPENCRPFIAIAEALRSMGLQTPEIFDADVDNGFLLLTDFGDTTFLQALRQQPSTAHAENFYKRALRVLSIMQACRSVPNHALQPFGREWMEREWVWHQEWFLEKWLGISVAEHPDLHLCYELLIQEALSQPQVFMHRDYHSANLMLLPAGEVGVLDFQDACIGPLTYDLASLLRDCYIDWPETLIQNMLEHYADLLRGQQSLQVPNDMLRRWFDWMGLQRHIKALMTFARKSVRDGEPRYLEFVPRTLQYIIEVSQQYPQLYAITAFYADTVQLAVKDASTVCEQ